MLQDQQSSSASKTIYRVFYHMKFSNFFNKIYYLRRLFITQFVYKFMFGKIGDGTAIYTPLYVGGQEFIYIGARVFIRNHVRLEAIQKKNCKEPKLIIGDRCLIEQNVQIIAGCHIEIGNDVSIAGCCAIVDVSHPFENDGPANIGYRLNMNETFVKIGSGSFIGYGSVILPNVILGEGCIVGANSVVTTSFPCYSVIAGSPAKLIRSYKRGA